jgi:hypothetical protein
MQHERGKTLSVFLETLHLQSPVLSGYVDESASVFIMSFLNTYRGGILGRNWDKNLKTFAACYSQSPPPSLYILEVAVFFFLLHFIYKSIHLIPQETIIRNAWKGGKPNRKLFHPYGFRNPTKQSISEETSRLFMNSTL